MNLRYFWRSVASVLVALFVLSPTLCYASETVTTESSIQSNFSISNDEISTGYLNVNSMLTIQTSEGYYYPFYHDYLSFSSPFSSTYDSENLNNYWLEQIGNLCISFDFNTTNGFNIFDKDSVIDLTFDGLKFSYRNNYTWSIVNVGGGSSYLEQYFDVSKCSYSHIFLFPTVTPDWSNYKAYEITDYLVFDNRTIGVNIEDLEIPFDVKSFRITFNFPEEIDELDSADAHQGFKGWGDYGYYSLTYDNSILRFVEKDSSVGLLNGIIEWLKSIKEGITNVKDSILELPNKIWTAMENGLKGLFVPSEADMVAYKDKWDELLAERFGVVYQSGTLITDTLGTITEQSAQGTINMPATTIHFAETDFTFGGYDVPVVPQGFEWLVEIIKGLIDIVVTVAFINAMRTKYDQLMRG